jgi:hypothetical protein
MRRLVLYSAPSLSDGAGYAGLIQPVEGSSRGKVGPSAAKHDKGGRRTTFIQLKAQAAVASLLQSRPPQDGGLNAISKNHLVRDMTPGRDRWKAKSFFGSVLLIIVSCFWVLFWFGVLTSITNEYSSLSPEPVFFFCMLIMAAVPFGFIAMRLIAR